MRKWLDLSTFLQKLHMVWVTYETDSSYAGNKLMHSEHPVHGALKQQDSCRNRHLQVHTAPGWLID